MKIARLFLLVSAALAPSPAALAETGDWGEGSKAEVRLIAGGFAPDGTLDAAIEIIMPDGWHTYWRTPGDAGIAPTFNFSGSENVGNVTVSFPVPERYDDGVSVSNVYVNSVVLPLTVPVSDATRPVSLSVAVDLGVCADVCVPDAASASLVVQPGETDPSAAAVIAAARERLPGAPVPGVLAVESVTRDGGTDKRPIFRVTAATPSPHDAQIFVEGPEDWSPYQPELAAVDAGKGVWTSKFSRLGSKTPIAGAQIRVTIVDGDRAIEQTVPLD